MPRIKTDDVSKHIDIDTDTGVLKISGKLISKPNEINILKFGTENSDRFVIKFPAGEAIDSREYNGAERLLTLIPRVFPKVKIITHQTKSLTSTLIAFGLLLSLSIFIVIMVI